MSVKIITINNVKINITDNDTSILYVTFFENNKNIFPRIILRGFIEEMEFYDIDISSGTFNNEDCFIVKKDISTGIIEAEIEHFITNNF